MQRKRSAYRTAASGLMRVAALALALFIVEGGGRAEAPNGAKSEERPAAVRPSLQAYQDVAGKLVGQLGEVGSRDDLPGADDPVFRGFSEQATALTTALGTAQYPIEIGTFETICGPSARVLVSYQLAGLNRIVTRDTPADAAKAATEKLAAQNMERYFDQLFPILVFSAHCTAVHVPAFESFAAQLPPREMTEVRKQGLRQVRNGLFNQIGGLLIVVSDPGLDDARRTATLATIARDIGRIAPALSLDARSELAQAVGTLRSNLKDDARIHADAILAGLRIQQCGVICSA